jgi:nitrite reductase (NADH) small subunit/3-phenylpropionate/trans-cinnamate dioxygenase ferredoxin subunit
MTEYHSICRVEELAEGEGRVFSVAGKLIAVFHHAGQYFAIDDTCPHMGDSLSQGYVEEGIVTCPWHAWRFRLADGAWADNPRIKIGSYQIRVAESMIQVAIDTVEIKGE